MKYDFSSLIDRHGMDSIAVDSWGEIPGMAPNAPDEGFEARMHALVDRVASRLQRDGIAPGAAVAICAANSARYAAVFLGALRAGIALAPLSPSVTPDAFGAMLRGNTLASSCS